MGPMGPMAIFVARQNFEQKLRPVGRAHHRYSCKGKPLHGLTRADALARTHRGGGGGVTRLLNPGLMRGIELAIGITKLRHCLAQEVFELGFGAADFLTRDHVAALQQAHMVTGVRAHLLARTRPSLEFACIHQVAFGHPNGLIPCIALPEHLRHGIDRGSESHSRQDGQSLGQIVEVTIVKGDSHHPASLVAAQIRHQLAHGQALVAQAIKPRHLRLKVGHGHRQRTKGRGTRRGRCDLVVGQDRNHRYGPLT